MIIVLGMNRSGTSVVTELIASMGATVGLVDRFFEHQTLVRVNEALVHSWGWTWCSTPDPKLVTPPDVEAAVDAAIASLELPGVVKDPRMCLTLARWLPRVPDPVVVFVYRDPSEVAESLIRNGVPPAVSLRLQTRFGLEAVTAASGVPSILVNHGKLLSDPYSEANVLLRGLRELGCSDLREPDSRVVDIKKYRSRRGVISTAFPGGWGEEFRRVAHDIARIELGLRPSDEFVAEIESLPPTGDVPWLPCPDPWTGFGRCEKLKTWVKSIEKSI